MFPLITDNRIPMAASSQTMNGNSINGMQLSKLLQLKMSTAAMMASVSEEEQYFYNHHIIENFIESVREMNDVVLIPSKLKDLDPATTTTTTAANTSSSSSSSSTSQQSNAWNTTTTITATSSVALNDDLYSYYQMINIVKNDLFEPYSETDNNKRIFQMPKRKISRQQRQQQRDNANNTANITRNISTSSLSSLLNGNNNIHYNVNNNNLSNSSGSNSGNVSNSSGTTTPNGQHSPTVVDDFTSDLIDTSNTNNVNNNIYQQMLPLSQEQLIQQQFNAKQLTLQFNHHLHSLYTILDHFTQAADFITQSYIKEFEQCNNM